MAGRVFCLVSRLGVGLALIAGLPACTKVRAALTEAVRSEPGRALICGGGGTVTGAAFYFGCNALTGKKSECIVGSAAMALADGLYCWWRLSQKIVNDYDDTSKTLHYDPNQGTVVKILEFGATHKIVRPGDELKIRVKYALMSDYFADEIKVEENFTLPNDKKPRREIITRQPGTWGAGQDYSVKIDSSTPEGKVELTLELKLVDRHGKQDRDRRTLCFNVIRSGEPPKSQLCGSATDGGFSGTCGTFIVSKIKAEASVRAEPKTKARVLAHVRRGERFPIVDTNKKRDSHLWYKIQLEDGREGWLPANVGALENE